MTEAERLQHIDELKDCLKNLLDHLEPAPVTLSIAMSQSRQLRLAADRAERYEALVLRAKHLIALKA